MLCNGLIMDWGIYFGLEEYEFDVCVFEDFLFSFYKDVINFVKFYFGDMLKVNFYYYGWISEILVDESGNVFVVKYYSIGCFLYEMMQVFSDNKIVFFGDDGFNIMMFMYVVDKEKDFLVGIFYVVKFK